MSCLLLVYDVVCWLLSVVKVRCLSCVVCCEMFVVNRVLRVDCCLLFVVNCMFVVYCLLLLVVR